MNRLEQSFADLAAAGRRCLVPYFTVGYPDVATTVAILKRLPAAGIGAVELGIPFSDPIADGPVIQTSFFRALEAGFRLEALFAALAAARAEIALPLVAMVSYSIVQRRGPEAFVDAAGAAGIDGILAPDLSLEEADGLAEICRAREMGCVLICAPTTTPERRRRIGRLSTPFVYYQAVAGITGERGALPADLAASVAAVRTEAGKPVCVGFGVSTATQVRAVCGVADGAIVGSAIVRRMNAEVERGAAPEAVADAVVELIAELAVAAQ